jgi:hypothetical protein
MEDFSDGRLNEPDEILWSPSLHPNQRPLSEVFADDSEEDGGKAGLACPVAGETQTGASTCSSGGASVSSSVAPPCAGATPAWNTTHGGAPKAAGGSPASAARKTVRKTDVGCSSTIRPLRVLRFRRPKIDGPWRCPRCEHLLAWHRPTGKRCGNSRNRVYSLGQRVMKIKRKKT